MGSFSIDLSAIFSMAAQWFNNLVPIASIGLGITIGTGLIGLMVRTIKGAL